MKLKHLKKFRLYISLLIFIAIFLYFMNIFGGGVKPFASGVIQLQFLPSLVKFLTSFFVISALGFLFVLLLTMLFGRVYCSSLCPMGTLQDIFIRTSSWFKSKKKKRFRYTKDKVKYLRWGIVVLTLIFWFSGSLFLVNLLDPYSNFGKITVTLFQPVFSAVNNGTSFILEQFDIYWISPVLPQSLPFEVILVSVLIFLLVLSLSIWRGRLFCNTICPVGGILSVLSSKPVFQIEFENESCNLCGKCEINCKAECIDSRNKVVDTSRCISCFNCFSACSNNGLSFKNNLLKHKTEPETTSMKEIKPDNDRRNFLLGLAGATLSIPVLNKKAFAIQKNESGGIPSGTENPVTPPGSVGYDHFTNNCVACYLCVSACPTNVIVPSFFDYGLQGFMQPKMDYHKSFCNFDCVACTEVCPTDALQKLLPEQKKTSQLGTAHFIEESCVVSVDKTDCGACSEHCPTKAVDMVPYGDGLWIPEVNNEICIGCGACEYACPTTPYKAIYIESNLVHLEAKAIEDDEGPREHDEDEFPF